jgi:hypothetical protein
MHSTARQALFIAVALAGAGGVVVFGCDSEDRAVEETPEAGGNPNASANCVKPGTKNNDQGIGGYCETNDDCVSGKSLCTALYGAPDNAWFCTRPCKDDPNCGDGLYCAIGDPRGVACVPIVCGVLDGGADAIADSPSDAASDDSGQ